MNFGLRNRHISNDAVPAIRIRPEIDPIRQALRRPARGRRNPDWGLSMNGTDMQCSTYSLICVVQEYVECSRAGAEELSVFGSKYYTYLAPVEQGDQFVGDAKLSAFQ